MDFFIYLVCLGVGLLFTLLTLIFGHVLGGGHHAHLGGSGGHAEAGADSSDTPGISLFSPTIITMFVTAFGGYGLVLREIPGLGKPLFSAPLAACGAILTAGVLFYILQKLFRSTQSSSESRISELAGAVGHIITPIPENGVGEIAYVQGGSRYTAPAREESGAPVPNGAAVKIVRIVGTQFYVKSVQT
jgi:membrane protein implicated in regulation of membrane protease activity